MCTMHGFVRIVFFDSQQSGHAAFIGHALFHPTSPSPSVCLVLPPDTNLIQWSLGSLGDYFHKHPRQGCESFIVNSIQ